MELHPAPTLWDVLVNDHGDATVVVPDFSDTSARGAARALVNDVSPLSFAELEAVDDAKRAVSLSPAESFTRYLEEAGSDA